MWRRALLAIGLGVSSSVLLAAETVTLELWPKGLPAGSKQLPAELVQKLQQQSDEEHLRVVVNPTLTVFLPEQRNGCAVVVCPGGGYNVLAWKKEGIEIAQWLNTLGVTAAVLKYRVPRRDPDRPYFEPLQDAQRAIRLLRQNAQRWDIDPNRVGILGFSAGGHLTVMAGTHWQEQTYDPVDEADKLSCRPDFMVPIYCAYLGKALNDRTSTELGPLVKVTKETPPTFMAVTWDDAMRAALSAQLFVKLKKAGVPAELHVFVTGGHGYGMRPGKPVAQLWPKLCAIWMREMGLLDADKTQKQ